jgi:hypothetical protein
LAALLLAALALLAVACGGGDDGDGEATDAGTAPSSSAPTSTADDGAEADPAKAGSCTASGVLGFAALATYPSSTVDATERSCSSVRAVATIRADECPDGCVGFFAVEGDAWVLVAARPVTDDLDSLLEPGFETVFKGWKTKRLAAQSAASGEEDTSTDDTATDPYGDLDAATTSTTTTTTTTTTAPPPPEETTTTTAAGAVSGYCAANALTPECLRDPTYTP